MALIKWRPWAEIEALKREMDRMWERFFGESSIQEVGAEWIPPLDVAETKDEIIVTVELPGVDPSNVEVTVANGILTIKGEKKHERKDERYHLIERTYGTFTRSIRLPVDFDENNVKATYKDGVLKIVLPKVEKAKEKEIKIQIEK
jgi:HSP20 family protein